MFHKDYFLPLKNELMIQSKIRLLQKLHPLLSTLSTTKRQSKHEVSWLLDYPPYFATLFADSLETPQEKANELS